MRGLQVLFALVPLVNTQVGGGNLFHGATRPFGMVQAGACEPQCTGYSQNFLSGADMPSAYSNDFPIVPVADEAQPWRKGERATVVEAAPGYFSAAQRDQTRTELTATPRSTMMRIHFPADGKGVLSFPMEGVAGHELKFISPYELRGWVRRDAYLIHRARSIFLELRFNRPMESFGEMESGPVAHFNPGAALLVKVGVSFVSAENAKANLDSENPNWDFEEVRAQARAEWEETLSKIEVTGGSDAERRIFYTALYQVFLHPNLSSDVCGEYLGFDDRVHQAGNRAQYVNFSGWDIYRSWMPLVSLLDPERASQMMESLVRDASEGGGGAMPRWSAGTVETGVMEGGSATPIVAQALAFGARDFDLASAWSAISATEARPGASCQGVEERPDLARYLGLGYVPYGEDRIGRQSAALTLDYALGDFAASRIAEALGDPASASLFRKLSGNWKNLLDHSTGFIRPRDADGGWRVPFDPAKGD
ncbi:MAG: glycoside hydrolase domain-containing protein, partial [Bdellovibrionota bacterium]